MISGNVPYHLIYGARAGFLQSVKDIAPLWQQVAMVANLETRSLDLVDLGASPMPKESKTGMTIQDFIEKHVAVKPKDWDITVYISYNALKDDRIGDLERRVRGAGANFNKHLNSIVFSALDAGDGSTYGLSYDGLSLFNANHVDSGANYQTVQNNVNALALSLDNFDTVYTALSQIKDDQGEYMAFTPDLLIVPPALKRTAAQICDNKEAYDTTNREANPYAGQIGYITVPWLNSTAWVLMDSTGEIKPIIVAMREAPNLQDAWFDPDKPDGGWYCFKFYARYNAMPGSWQSCQLGNT